jgi:uncharacterized protein (UPF0332 family)
VASVRTTRHQFALSAEALHEAEHLHKARYYSSSVSHSYATVLHAAAGLLYGLGYRPQTEREVRIGFAAQFVAPHRVDPALDRGFRRLEELRQRADFDHDATLTHAESDEALGIARQFHAEAVRLRREVLGDNADLPKDPKEVAK